MSHTRVQDLLSAIRAKLGNEARRQIAEAVQVEPRAVDYWFQQGDTVHLREGNLKALVRFARSIDVDPRQFEVAPPLWRRDLSFEDQLRYDPGPYPESLGFQSHHVAALGRALDSYFGTSAGPIAVSPQQMYYLAKTEIGRAHV